MNKKTLLGGAAALLLGAGFLAAPASAAIEFGHSGDVKLTATFDDRCATAASTLTANQVIANADANGGAVVGVRGAIADYLLFTYTEDEDDANADQFEEALIALTGGTLAGTTAPLDAVLDGDVSFNADPCGGANVDDPVWKTGTTLDWSASGTLANGLEVSVNNDAEMAFTGNFGTLSFKPGGDSGAKNAHVGGDGDISVSSSGPGFGGHALGTSGTAGMVVGYALPSVGGLDLNITYAPNAADTGLDSSEFTDTFSIGASMNLDMLALSFGFESAESSDTACWTKEVTVTANTQTAAALLDSVYGTDICGDEELMVIGASMSAAGLDITAGFSELDSEEADRETTSFNIETVVSDLKINVGYTNSVLSSALGGADTEQTTIGGSIATSLGDGVDLTLKAATNEYDDASQATARGGNGATNDFYAQAELKVSL